MLQVGALVLLRRQRPLTRVCVRAMPARQEPLHRAHQPRRLPSDRAARVQSSSRPGRRSRSGCVRCVPGAARPRGAAAGAGAGRLSRAPFRGFRGRAAGSCGPPHGRARPASLGWSWSHVGFLSWWWSRPPWPWQRAAGTSRGCGRGRTAVPGRRGRGVAWVPAWRGPARRGRWCASGRGGCSRGRGRR